MIVRMVKMPPHDKYTRCWGDRVLVRVFAGFCHPSEQHSGAICVIGEEIERIPYYYIMRDYESRDISDLLRTLAECHRDYKIQETYADTSDSSFMAFLSHYNGECERKGVEGIQLNKPYHFNDGNLTYHRNLLREYLRIGNKRLHLGDSSLIKSALQQPFNDQDNYHIHPTLTATAWAFAALASQPYSPVEDKSVYMALR
jgi:hypothetical protein